MFVKNSNDFLSPHNLYSNKNVLGNTMNINNFMSTVKQFTMFGDTMVKFK